MALAANTIITQSSTAAYAPAAKARDNTSSDQTSSFEDVLAQQDTSATTNNAQTPAQGADKAKTSQNTQIASKFGKASDDQAATDALATADGSQSTPSTVTTQSTKVRAGKPGDKAKNNTMDGKSVSEAVNDNESSNVGNLTQQVALIPALTTPSTPQPSTAVTASNLDAIAGATNKAAPTSPGADNTNTNQPSQGTDETADSDETQAADGAPASGKALSSDAFQKMLGATKAAAAKDSQAAKAAPDKDLKAADANVGSTNTGTDVTSDVKPAVPTNTGVTSTVSTASQVGTTATAASGPTATATAQSTAAPNLDSLAVEITAKAQSGAKQFNIRLDPPELGRVEVRLSIDATGKAQAHLSADQPQTLELLQKDAPALTQALRDAGLDVSQSGLNFSLKNQQQNSGGNNSASQSNYDGTTISSAAAVIDTSSAGSSYTSGAGLLDIKI